MKAAKLPRHVTWMSIAFIASCSSAPMTTTPLTGEPAGAAAVSDGRTGSVAGTSAAAPPSTSQAGAGSPAPQATGGARSTTPPAAGATAGAAGTPALPNAGASATAGTSAAAGASGAVAAAGAPATAGAPAAPSGTILPAIDNPGTAGPFRSEFVSTAPGLSSHSLFIPSEPGSNGKNPVVVWTCGNGGTVSFYQSFLEHLASHGFFVVADKGSSSDRLAEVESQGDAIAWVLAESMKAGGSYKLDTTRIAVMGHSLGSLASFATAAKNEHIVTSIHFSGGLTGNPVGFDMSWLKSMTKPTAFLCGGRDTTAGPACEQDFAQAPPALPVFYGVLAGADHLGPFALTPRAGEYGRAGVAWLRWKLAGDDKFTAWFAGASCTLCSSPWTAKQRNLE